MSAIAGFFKPTFTYTKENSFCQSTIHNMSQALLSRGPNMQNIMLFSHGAFCHNALLAGCIHPQIPCAVQPLTKAFVNGSLTLLYDGYITNLLEICDDLSISKAQYSSLTQEEILLLSFQKYGTAFVQKLDGAFALIIYDEAKETLYLFRDQLGLKPLFYMYFEQTLIFASEPKGIFSFPNVVPTIDREGLNEIFSMGPAHSLGKGVFKNMHELEAGHLLICSKNKQYKECYHTFLPTEHKDSYLDTVDHVNELLSASIDTLSATSEAPTSLLSGGLDSSVITAKLSSQMAHLDKTSPLKTFSFDFKGSRNHFVSNSFQPTLDAPFVHQMVDTLNTDHTTLVCGNTEQIEYLQKSVLAHDCPAMADIDSSLIYFCEKIAASHKTIFTGECADELFAGYPWYHRSDMYNSKSFPWSADTSPRKELLNVDFISKLSIDSYIDNEYQSACQGTLFQDNTHAKTMYLTIRYFMQTLVDRTDRAASFNSLDIRVPFADFRLAEYLFHVPYEIKTKNGEVKHLLREYAKGLLPEAVRTRKKSPYPKTYDPNYEKLLSALLLKVISDPNSPLLAFVNRKKIYDFCQSPKDYGKPWYGQLMAGPQLMAYYLQINFWLTHYQIKVDLT